MNFKSISELNYYKKKYKISNCLISKEWGDKTLSLPFHIKLTEKEIKEVSKQIKIFFEKKINL